MANLRRFSIKTEDPDNLYQIYTTHADAGSAGHYKKKGSLFSKLTKITFVCWFASFLINETRQKVLKRSQVNLTICYIKLHNN